MKIKILTLLVCAFALYSAAGAQEKPKAPVMLKEAVRNSAQTTLPDAKEYAKLLDKLKGGDTKIDFKALRMAYTQTKDYSAYGIDGQVRSKMFELLDQKKYAEAVKAAEDVLKTNYVEMNAHFVAWIAHEELKNTEKSAFHKQVFNGLVESILAGADGKTPKTAFTVICVPEEYVILSVLKIRRTSQSVVNEDGHKYDLLVVTDPETKAEGKIYFNIDIVWKGYEKMLGK